MIPFPLKFDPPQGWDVVLPAPAPGAVTLAPRDPRPAGDFRPRILVGGSLGDDEDVRAGLQQLARSLEMAMGNVTVLDVQIASDPPTPVALHTVEIDVFDAGRSRLLRHLDMLLDVAGPDTVGGRRRLHLAATSAKDDFADTLEAFEQLLDTLEVDD